MSYPSASLHHDSTGHGTTDSPQYRLQGVNCLHCGEPVWDPQSTTCSSCGSTVDVRSQLLIQRIDLMLFHGRMFGMLWIGGLGSAYAVMLGIRASQLIRQSSLCSEKARTARATTFGGAFGILVVIGIIIAVAFR